MNSPGWLPSVPDIRDLTSHPSKCAQVSNLPSLFILPHLKPSPPLVFSQTPLPFPPFTFTIISQHPTSNPHSPTSLSFPQTLPQRGPRTIQRHLELSKTPIHPHRHLSPCFANLVGTCSPGRVCAERTGATYLREGGESRHASS